MAITVEGKRYIVVDNMGFNHSIGMYVKTVKTDSGNKVAVRYPGVHTWRFWGAKDRVAPLVEAIFKGWPKKVDHGA